MKRIYLIFILSLHFLKSYPCKCLGISDYYTFYKYNTYSFVGKVLEGNTEKSQGGYIIEVLDKLRSSYSGTIIIQKEKFHSDCSPYFVIGKVYLLSPTISKGLFYASKCSVISNSEDPSFREDTMMIKLFSKPEIKISCSHFKGEIKNGVQEGLWEFKGPSGKVYEFGSYRNGKKDGEWKALNETEVFKKGKMLKRTEQLDDSARITVITDSNGLIMYDSTGRVMKKLTRHKYLVYGSKGQILERANVKKNGYFHGTWKSYNEDGSIKDELKINIPEIDISAMEQFYWYLKPTDFNKWR